MPSERHPDNVAGDWYIDRRCIDCASAESVAPGLIGRSGGQAVFLRQPATPEEIEQAWRARLLCPTASIHTETPAKAPRDLFPQRLTERVYRLGYNARESYGAHSYAVLAPHGVTMIDAPRWTERVVASLDAWGGLRRILLTHRDDVADAERYAQHYGASVWIHEDDRSAAPFATDLVRGQDPVDLGDEFVAIALPGHTRGSVAYLHADTHLFTGDSLAWDFRKQSLVAWKDVCWYSWPAQLASLRRLLDRRFEWVIAGHGGSHGDSAQAMRAQLAALLDRLET